MAISANRYLVLLILLTAATACYIVGVRVGFWVLIAIGAILELAFWYKLFFRRRH